MVSNQNPWPKKSAVVITDSKNFASLVNQNLSNLDWTVALTTPSAEQANQAIASGQACVLVIDDSKEAHAIHTVRQLLTQPITSLTPMLCFLVESHRAEIPILRALGGLEIAEKPLTPSGFAHVFRRLIRTWEEAELSSIRKATYLMPTLSLEKKVQLFYRLSGGRRVGRLTLPVLAHLFVESGDIKKAETVLLANIKFDGAPLRTILALSYIYLQVAMPNLAGRLLNAIRQRFNQTNLIVADLIQADILLGSYPSALDLLQTIKSSYPDPELVTTIETYILLSQNNHKEAKKRSLEHPGVLRSLEEIFSDSKQAS